jgi:hypothetical protein
LRDKKYVNKYRIAINSSTMECPECGYDVEEGANFCPQCRHRFPEPEPEPDILAGMPVGEVPVLPAYGSEDFSEPATDEERFSGKELQFLKIQLIQPAMLLVAGVALAGYVTVPQLQTVTFAYRNIAVPAGGAICLFAGLIVGGIFYWGMSARLKGFKGK